MIDDKKTQQEFGLGNLPNVSAKRIKQTSLWSILYLNISG